MSGRTLGTDATSAANWRTLASDASLRVRASAVTVEPSASLPVSSSYVSLAIVLCDPATKKADPIRRM